MTPRAALIGFVIAVLAVIALYAGYEVGHPHRSPAPASTRVADPAPGACWGCAP